MKFDDRKFPAIIICFVIIVFLLIAFYFNFIPATVIIYDNDDIDYQTLK